MNAVGPGYCCFRHSTFGEKNGEFKKIEEILEISRSGPCLLNILFRAGRPPVSRNLKNAQEIARSFTPGGRSGGLGEQQCEDIGCSIDQRHGMTAPPSWC
jgi:hypothetical protein